MTTARAGNGRSRRKRMNGRHARDGGAGIAPLHQQRLEGVAKQHPLELRMQGEHLQRAAPTASARGGTPPPRWSTHRCRRAPAAHRRSAASSVSAGRCSGRPRAAARTACRRGCRSRSCKPYSRSSSSACALICQPAAACDAAGSRTRARRPARPRSNSVRVHAASAPRHAVLPAHVIVGMQAHLEAGIVHPAHVGPGFAADVRARQQHAVHQGLRARSASGPRCAPPSARSPCGTPAQRAPRVVGPDRKIKRRADAVLLEQRREPRHALARAAQRIDIDLEADVRVSKHRARQQRRGRGQGVRVGIENRRQRRAHVGASASSRAPPSCS